MKIEKSMVIFNNLSHWVNGFSSKCFSSQSIPVLCTPEKSKGYTFIFQTANIVGCHRGTVP